MHPIKKLLSKKDVNIIGMMSGTSLDGLDLSYCRISHNATRHGVKIIKTGYFRFDPVLKRNLQALVSEGRFTKSFIKQADDDLGQFYAASVKRFMKKFGIRPVDMLGCHGQTILHLDKRLSKSKTGRSATWQIGSSSRLASITGLPVVSDFRSADVALGGSGAPLTPLCHYHLFGQDDRNIAVLNIGGITNLTFLPEKSGRKKIRASDCGPGNMLVDQLTKMLFGRDYDKGGRIASTGVISKRLLGSLKRRTWFTGPHPKSLGREQFGADEAMRIIERGRRYGISNRDIITTVSELTVISVLNYIENLPAVDKLIVCGGGASNNYFMTRLSNLIPRCAVISSEEAGLDPDYVEAACFALLAALWVFGEPANLQAVTGASKQTLLGRLTLP
ncbi:MAG TPA: anhydro-N-acetylmuramic acid kinase [candidate division Zixibacteria bacterium]|nr:anhydro-N-acetylmuramic acid kinase [candidate division Zixibacteria bacterium]HEQ98966.1 anhydro-N-acetylmuramic acid kinase [candidate division Zixibacteria bacterium]